MQTNEITNQSAWEGFVASQHEAQFLQSWAWGEFQESIGRSVVRLGIERNGKLVAAGQAIRMRHPLGRTSLYIPRGPIVDPHLPLNEYRSVLAELISSFREKAKQLGADFLRVESPLQRTSPSSGMFGIIQGWKQFTSHQPSASLLLNLAPDEGQLLASFHQKTRYNLNLAKRKGVTIRRVTDEKSISTFLALSHETAARDHITIHPDDYFSTMLGILGKEEMAQLFLAEYEGTVLAANIVIRYGDTVTYLHGASSNDSRNVMAPYLLQWEQMRWAKASGAHWYDFWGIAPSDADATHAWAGITRFKKGFGGEERMYMDALELPLRSFWYCVVQIGRKMRKP